MSGCYIETANAGWWNLLMVVVVALIPLAVMAGMQWGRMAEADDRSRR